MYISKPCPKYFKSKDRTGDDFHCNSCNKIVVDYTKMSIEEIKANLTPNSCGIFREDQLSRKTLFTWTGAIRFYALVLISFLGFHVQPIEAQTVPKDSISKDTANIEMKKDDMKTENDADKKDLKKTKKRKGLFRRKRIYRYKTMGCPNF